MTEAGDRDLRVLLPFVEERCTQPAWRWAKVLDPVPRRDLTRAMVDGIDSLLADLESDTANVVLTFARIWSTLATDAFRSKYEAADWVLPRLPAGHRPVLACARAMYRGAEDEPWSVWMGSQLMPTTSSLRFGMSPASTVWANVDDPATRPFLPTSRRISWCWTCSCPSWTASPYAVGCERAGTAPRFPC